MKFKNVTMVNCGTGFSVPAGGGAMLDVENVMATDVKTFFEERSTEEDFGRALATHLGLPPHTNLVELASVIRDLRDHTDSDRQRVAHDSSFLNRLGAGAAGTAALGANLLTICTNPKVIEWIGKMLG